MCKVAGTVWIFVASGLLCGCGGTSDEERLKVLVPDALQTIPVEGKVLVDGEPVKDIWVKLHADDERPHPVLPKGRTEPDGTFRITTYIAGDGAPRGHYRITVEWLTFHPAGSRWVGPNKIDEKYGNVKTSPFEVAVDSDPVALPTLEVTAKADGEEIKGKVRRPGQNYKKQRERVR